MSAVNFNTYHSVDLGTALRMRDMQLARDYSPVVGETRCSGVIVCQYGESLVDIPFPVRFVAPPTITTGSELFPDAVLKPGHYPEIHGTVVSFDTKQSGEIGSAWTGMKMAIIVRGYKGLTGFLHWTAVGKAFTNPVSTVAGFGET